MSTNVARSSKMDLWANCGAGESVILKIVAGSRQRFRTLFLFRFDEIITRNTQQHNDRARYQYRRVDAEENTDGKRQRKIMQRLSTKEQHGGHDQLGAAMGDN